MSINMHSFMDELVKISVRLNDQERAKQTAQFTALGAASGPVIGAVGNLIQHGKFGPATNVPLKRWIPSQMVTGALISGAIPSVRNYFAGNIQEQAKHRANLQKLREERRLARAGQG